MQQECKSFQTELLWTRKTYTNITNIKSIIQQTDIKMIVIYILCDYIRSSTPFHLYFFLLFYIYIYFHRITFI